MTPIQQMYEILEQMVQSAIDDRIKNIRKLNDSYTELASRVYSNPMTTLDFKYESCRQSCIMTLTMPDIREELIEAAKQKLSEIPNPEKVNFN